MKIKIKGFSRKSILNLTLDGDNNILEYNGLEISKNLDSYIKKYLEIFSEWGNNTTQQIFDVGNYEVEIINNKTSKKFSEINNNFTNFKEFKSLIKELIACF